MQLSRYRNPFYQFFAAFGKSKLNVEYFGKKDEPHMWFVSEIMAWKKWGYLNA